MTTTQDEFSYVDQYLPQTTDEFSYLDEYLPKPVEPPKRGFANIIKDAGVTGLKAAVGLPQAFVGLADIPTGGHVGKALEEVGYRPGETQKTLESWYSPAQQEANRKVHEADGFTNTLQAAIENPSVIAHTVGESIPMMIGGAGIARGLVKAGQAAGKTVAPWAAGAIGEGVMGAGSAEEAIRGQTEDGLTTAKQSLSAAASGIGTAAFGALGGKLASSKLGQKFGLADIDTIMAGGGTNAAAAAAAKQGFVKQVIASGISEGALEELPQSIQEQMWQNFATDKPLTDGVGNAAALGLLAGGVMGGAGGGYNAMVGRVAPGQPPPPGTQPPPDGSQPQPDDGSGGIPTNAAPQPPGTPEADAILSNPDADALIQAFKSDDQADAQAEAVKNEVITTAYTDIATIEAWKANAGTLGRAELTAKQEAIKQAATAQIAEADQLIRTKQVQGLDNARLDSFVVGATLNRNRAPSQEFMLGVALAEQQKRGKNALTGIAAIAQPNSSANGSAGNVVSQQPGLGIGDAGTGRGDNRLGGGMAPPGAQPQDGAIIPAGGQVASPGGAALDAGLAETGLQASKIAGDEQQATTQQTSSQPEIKLGENIPPSQQPAAPQPKQPDPEMAKAIAALDAKMTPMSDIVFDHGKTYTLTYKAAGQPGATKVTGEYVGDIDGKARFRTAEGVYVHTSIPRTAIALVDGITNPTPRAEQGGAVAPSIQQAPPRPGAQPPTPQTPAPAGVSVSTGKIARTSLIEAFPVIDGKVKVNNQDGQRWATDARAKSANPEARTDFNPIQQKPQGVTPQVLSNAAAERIISAAADSVKTLRKSDVGRVLDETPAIHKLSMAQYIKDNRRDLAEEVDSVMAEEQPAAESKPSQEQQATAILD